ncbi:MAG: long-chain fatty acid--CoA ligase [Bowdeniella nasicola]|nr:long-chain fatty acid--CoA ligase [Bowdeniella nasicola]
MREFSTPTLVTSPHRNVTDLLETRLREAPNHHAFEVVDDDGAYRPVTTAEFAERVRALARGLIASGLQAGDRVAIMSATRYEWTLADLACLYAGAVVVPVYETAAPEQVSAILRNAGPRAAFVETDEHAHLLEAAFAEAGLHPHGIWRFAGQTDLAALARRGQSISRGELEERRLVAGPDDIATVVYTSGTTGRPRGACITHENFIHQMLNIAAAYGEVVREDGSTIIFLPLAHVLARGLQIICLTNGMRVSHLADPTRVIATLATLRPTFLVVVPRVLHKIREAVRTNAERKHLGAVWRRAERVAIEMGECHYRGRKASLTTRAEHALYDRLFYARIRALLGGRMTYMLSGAAPLEPDLCRLFAGIGIPIIEGYGLTETTAPLTGNLPGNTRAGTVGVPTPGATVRIADDGEVLARGPGVCRGYWDPRDDADAFVGGYFRTGDLGRLDEDGRLTLLGRCKEVVVTSSGKTIVPTVWEQDVERHPLVAHAVVIGDNEPRPAGLILVDPDALRERARAEGDEELAQVSAPGSGSPIELSATWLRAAVERAVQAANRRVSRAEQIREYCVLLADLTAHHDLFTPTQKVRRAALVRAAAPQVARLYRR